MAGSGKSTFAGALSKHVASLEGKEAYVVNLDPAVGPLNYEPNVDIRDTVDYKRVMEEYNLGPNGGILTALNLFTTKFDQVLGILESRSKEVDQIVLDTPGQIEIFTWSASGTIITDSLASAMPTCIAYVVDTPRTTAPATFMSNMLYACSIMYKTKLPFVLVFNKIDEQSHQFALDWMEDFENFQQALTKGNATEKVDVSTLPRGPPIPGATVGGGAPGDDAGGSYMNSLVNSMALVLDEFYNNIRAVGLSSTTGQGMDSFLDAVAEARREYVDEYRPELERIRNLKKGKEEDRKREEVRKMMRDLRVKGSASASAASKGTQGTAGGEDDEDPRLRSLDAATRGYDGDGQILDPDDVGYETRGAAEGQAGQDPLAATAAARRRRQEESAAMRGQ
ncbi:unnamed protein product [Parajaminaea phylloscopi]